MSTVIKIIILIAMLSVIAYGGLCVYSNCTGPDTGHPELPDIERATHSVYIKNTGGLILTSDHEVYGSEVGSRIFVLHGYWEMRGKDFKFVDGGIILNEAIFGEITLKKRLRTESN